MRVLRNNNTGVIFPWTETLAALKHMEEIEVNKDKDGNLTEVKPTRRKRAAAPKAEAPKAEAPKEEAPKAEEE